MFFNDSTPQQFKNTMNNFLVGVWFHRVGDVDLVLLPRLLENERKVNELLHAWIDFI